MTDSEPQIDRGSQTHRAYMAKALAVIKDATSRLAVHRTDMIDSEYQRGRLDAVKEIFTDQAAPTTQQVGLERQFQSFEDFA